MDESECCLSDAGDISTGSKRLALIFDCSTGLDTIFRLVYNNIPRIYEIPLFYMPFRKTFNKIPINTA